MFTNKIQNNNHQCHKVSSRAEVAHFISLSIDSSNHLDEKIVPLIVRYFHTEKDVMVKGLELVNLGGETFGEVSANFS
jgi:hypothetical protein